MSNDTVIVRPALPADLPHIADIFSRSFRTLDFLPRLHTVEEDFAFWRDVVMANQSVSVAGSEGEIAGVMAIRAGWITMLYVDPRRFRLGVGQALVCDAQRRYNYLQLWCFQQNRPARAFYERLGFAAAELTDGQGNAEKTPDVRYEWVR